MTDQIKDRRDPLEHRVTVIETKLEQIINAVNARITQEDAKWDKMNKFLMGLLILNGVVAVENIDRFAPIFKAFFF
jgi:uncharacterized coiled-coil protein SlyX